MANIRVTACVSRGSTIILTPFVHSNYLRVVIDGYTCLLRRNNINGSSGSGWLGGSDRGSGSGLYTIYLITFWITLAVSRHLAEPTFCMQSKANHYVILGTKEPLADGVASVTRGTEIVGEFCDFLGQCARVLNISNIISGAVEIFTGIIISALAVMAAPTDEHADNTRGIFIL